MLPTQKDLHFLKTSPAPTRAGPRLRMTPVLLLLILFAAAGSVRAQTWTQHAPVGGPPPSRCYGATTVYAPSSNRLILFGGRACPGGSPAGSLNDVWIMTNANGLGGPASWAQVSTTGGPPSSGESTTFDPATGRVNLYAANNANNANEV
jgi:hypothetical protein